MSLILENYVTKRNHIALERFFCDVLLTDVRMAEYQPKKTKLLDLFMHEIKDGACVRFQNGLIDYGIFINEPYLMKAEFEFPIPMYIAPDRWGWGEGEMQIHGNSSGFLGLAGKVKNLTIFCTFSDEKRIPGMKRVKSDSNLREKLLGIMQANLVSGNIKVKYAAKTKLRPSPTGLIQFKVLNSHKKWQEAIAEGLKPQDFMVDIFSSISSVVSHVKEYFKIEGAQHVKPKCCPKCGTETRTDFCPSCGHEMK